MRLTERKSEISATPNRLRIGAERRLEVGLPFRTATVGGIVEARPTSNRRSVQYAKFSLYRSTLSQGIFAFLASSRQPVQRISPVRSFRLETTASVSGWVRSKSPPMHSLLGQL